MSDAQTIKLWKTRERKGRKSPWEVRWRVGSSPFSRSFITKALADNLWTDLMVAARAGEVFSLRTGEPLSWARSAETFYLHARAFAAMRWPLDPPGTRTCHADQLAKATLATLDPGKAKRGRPDDKLLRLALRSYAFNVPTWDQPIPADVAEALAWVAGASRPVADLADREVIVGVLGAFAVNLNGKAAAAKTRARRRNVFHTCMEYAVTRKLLVSNPVTGVRLGGRTRADETVDPRTVPGMEAARRLLAAVGTLKTKTAGRAVHLAVFFAVMYYAGMRPAEVRGLKLADLVLPSSGGWGRAMLSGSVPEVGGAWSDDGERYSGQTLKHRAVGAVRIVPLPPTLVAVLLAHIAMWGTAADGRIFFDGPDQVMVSSGVLDRTWERARKAALTDAELAAGLAKRPYDLRHGCASYLLSLGTVPVKVAAWLGHSLPVLMNTYTHFIDGDETAALARIEAAHKAAEAATLPVTGGFPGGGLPAGQIRRAEAA